MNIVGQYRAAVVNEVRYPPGGKLGPRTQRNLQLVCVWTGEATVWVDGVRHEIGAGEQILLLPHHRERFRFSVTQPTHHGWCELTHPVVHKRVERFLLQAPQPVVGITRRSTRLVEEALTLRGATDHISTEMRRRLVESVLLEHVRVLNTLARSPLHPTLTLSPSVVSEYEASHVPDAVLRALEVVRDRFAEIRSTEEVASEAGCSPQHLARLFARHLGAPPASILWQVRTDHAIALIRSTGLSFDQVADQSGFQTTSHLSRRVKEHTGVPPRELRRLERNRSVDG